jgi:hypothetical protein
MPTADLTTAKLLINSTISRPGAIFLGVDLANFYLNTLLPDYKYMRLHLDIIPEEIVLINNLQDIAKPDRWVYIEIRMGMYGLPQAGILANNLLEKRLVAKGYYQCQHTPGLWRHIWRTIIFCLVVDNFGIKVTNMEEFNHLKTALKGDYKVAIDWTGLLFCIVKLMWDYKQHHVVCSMPGYISNALKKYQHPTPEASQDAPYSAAPI